MNRSYINLKAYATNPAFYKPKKKPPSQIKLQDSPSRLTNKLNNPKGVAHDSALRKVAELYSPCQNSFDVSYWQIFVEKDYTQFRDGRTRKHYSSKSSSRDPLNQNTLKFQPTDASKPLRKAAPQSFNHTLNHSLRQYASEQRKHYLDPKRDIISMTGKDLPSSFKAIRRHQQYYEKPSSSLIRLNNRGLLQGSSVSMKSSHAFKKTDPFSVEPAASPMMMMGKSSSLSGGVKEVRGRKSGPVSLVSSFNAQKCLMSSTTKFDKNVFQVPKCGAQLTIGYLKSGYQSMQNQRSQNRFKNQKSNFSISRQEHPR